MMMIIIITMMMMMMIMLVMITTKKMMPSWDAGFSQGKVDLPYLHLTPHFSAYGSSQGKWTSLRFT